MTGVLLNDLLSMLKISDGNDSRKANKFYFAHSETFLPFLTRLGIARDDPPLSLTNLPEERKWRTSLIGGESSNLAVVVLRCGGASKIQFYLNERIVSFPGCENNPCDLVEFVTKFEKFTLNNLNEVCKV